MGTKDNKLDPFPPHFGFHRDDVIFEVPLNKYWAVKASGHIHFDVSKVLDGMAFCFFNVKRLFLVRI